MTTREDADRFSTELERCCRALGLGTLRGGMLGAFWVTEETPEGLRRFLIEVSPGD